MKLTAEHREILERFRDAERRFARRQSPPPRSDPSVITFKPGEVRVIEGALWGCCGGCERIIRLDGRRGGLHRCVSRP